MRIESALVSMRMPRKDEAAEVKVRKQRRCRPSLRCSSLPVARFSRANPLHGRPLTHRGSEPAFDHRQHLTSGNATRKTPHQRAVRDRGEVIAEISVYHLPPVVLRDVEVRATYCHLRICLRSEPILLRQQVDRKSTRLNSSHVKI